MKSKRAKYRKGTTLFKANRYVVDGHGLQYIFKLFNYDFYFGKTQEMFYFRFGEKEKGFLVTEKPSFSIRNGDKKSFKICKYYITNIN